MKNCRDCGIEFVKTGRNHIRCSSCKIKEEKRKQKEYDLKGSYKKYGLTVEIYNEMFIKQNGSCVLCGTHQSALTKNLAVDHCHASSKIRGLLCQNCNLMLGFAKDNIETLEKAIKYLKKEK
jgi:hypothetical protein